MGRGRPRLPDDRVREWSIHATVTRTEYLLVKKAAKAVDMSISAWAREKILAGFPKR